MSKKNDPKAKRNKLINKEKIAKRQTEPKVAPRLKGKVKNANI